MNGHESSKISAVQQELSDTREILKQVVEIVAPKFATKDSAAIGKIAKAVRLQCAKWCMSDLGCFKNCNLFTIRQILKDQGIIQ